MPFSWPSFADVVYRLHRLRRLIACGIVMPLVVFAIVGAFGFGWVGSVGGLAVMALVLTVLIAGHAVAFPNAHQETVVLSLLLTALGFLAPVLGSSVFGWFLFVVFGFLFVFLGQTRVLSWEMSRKTHEPTFQSKVKTRAPLKEARAWFPLRPNSTRGQYRCGPKNAEGVFPVWYDMPVTTVFDALDLPEAADLGALEDALSDPETASFFAQVEDDEEDYQRTKILQSNNASGPVLALVEHHFKPLKNGCMVAEMEAANDYPWGQTFSLWLNDFAKDGLVYHRDLLEGIETRSLRAAHRWSLLMLLSKRVMKRMMGGSMAQMAADNQSAIEREVESSPEALAALLQRLGSDFTSQGYTSGPMPLVTLEEFFGGNGDDGSFQAASLVTARTALEGLRDRDDVADIRMGVTQWEGPSTWPLAEYVYFVTSAAASDVEAWLKDAGIWVSELAEEGEHRKREDLDVPEGYRMVWCWID
ncbi:MAG: hypothetical protein HKN27_11125 [Silicimonas sp.]|nr:hypothetical protein [Silicimonas sp.]